MGTWKPHRSDGVNSVRRREIEGLDRVFAYVECSQYDDEEDPLFYSWSVQDGSCGKVLDSGYTDSSDIRNAYADADAAVAALFPGH